MRFGSTVGGHPLGDRAAVVIEADEQRRAAGRADGEPIGDGGRGDAAHREPLVFMTPLPDNVNLL